MLLLLLCLVGSVVALPAVPQAPILLADVQQPQPLFVSNSYILRSYPAPPELAPFKPLEIKIEPVPRDENAGSSEPNQELSEFPAEPKEPAPEEPKPTAPGTEETVIIQLGVPKSSILETVLGQMGGWFNAINSGLFSSGLDSQHKMLYPTVMVIGEAKP